MGTLGTEMVLRFHISHGSGYSQFKVTVEDLQTNHILSVSSTLSNTSHSYCAAFCAGIPASAVGCQITHYLGTIDP